MKRLVSIVLILCMALPFALSGCSVVSKGSDYCIRYIDTIIARDFDRAFDMIADSVKIPDVQLTAAERRAQRQAEKDKAAAAEATPTPEATEAPTPTPSPTEMIAGSLPAGATLDPNATPDPDATPDPAVTSSPSDTPEPTPTAEPTSAPTPSPTPTATPQLDEDGNVIIAKTISRKDFVEKYTSVFEELQLTGIDYEVTDITDGEIYASVNYTLTYHSERGGDLVYDFEIIANRVEHQWCIAWSPNLLFPMMDWGDNVRVGVLQASRGEILCDGEPYAQNVNVVTVFAVPSTVVETFQAEAKTLNPDIADEDLPTAQEAYEDFARRVSAITELETDEASVLKALNRQINNFAKIQTFFPDEMGIDLQNEILAIKGLAIDTNNYGSVRYYPHGESLCHIVGYAGIITKEKKLYYERIGDTRYNGDSWIGNYGLEYVYEDTLLGTNGRFTYIQDSKGGSKGVLYREEAVDGKDLHLTIDPELQERLETVIDNTVYDTTIHGAVVVLNPRTGELQAMTSFPGFDLNYLCRGVPEEEWGALKSHPDIPLYNRVTQGLYTPGSVFKTMTAAALLETGTMSASDVFAASEQAYIDGDSWMPSDAFMASLPERADSQTFAEQAVGKALKRTANTNRHQPMNMINSIIDSDNLFFAYGGLRMGWTKFQKYLEKVGWAEPLELENTGIFDEELELYKKLETSTPQIYDITKKQYDYDLAVTGYGQGQLLVSPLQMAVFVSAYANNGVAMQPYVVDSIWHASGTDYTLVEQREPKVWKHMFQQSTVDTVLPALRLVTTEGTAKSMNKSFITKRIFNLGYNLAGKTGTAEITNDKTKELAWFVCWRDTYSDTGAPVSDEDARLVCVMLEVNLPMGFEWSQMKYDIARALLKDDILNKM